MKVLQDNLIDILNRKIVVNDLDKFLPLSFFLRNFRSNSNYFTVRGTLRKSVGSKDLNLEVLIWKTTRKFDDDELILCLIYVIEYHKFERKRYDNEEGERWMRKLKGSPKLRFVKGNSVEGLINRRLRVLRGR